MRTSNVARRRAGRRSLCACIETVESRMLLSVELVAEINATRNSSGASEHVTVGDIAYFAATDAEAGRELWRTDGTTAGTYRVKDISEGPTSSGPTKLTRVGGHVFFLAASSLWKTDGTEAGTVCLGMVGSSAGILFAAGNCLYITNSVGVYFSDGTPEGTRQAMATNGAQLGFDERIAVGENLLFMYGRQPWVSDGTIAGTHQIKDINPKTSGAWPGGLVVLNGVVYFHADDAAHGIELWRSDLTADGTYMLKDIRPGSASSMFDSGTLHVMGERIYFSADDGVHGRELWHSDGTEAGTEMLVDISSGTASSGPGGFNTVGSRVFFAANVAAHGTEMWATDGTPQGTVMLADINEGAGAGSLGESWPHGQEILFPAHDVSGQWWMYRSDGTPDGTMAVAPITQIWLTTVPRQVGGLWYFTCTDSLWRTDGTTEGTFRLPLSPGSPIETHSAAAGGKLVFQGKLPDGRSEPHVSDGTVEGTTLLKDIGLAPVGSANISHLTRSGDRLYFLAKRDGDPYIGLWTTDRTTEGTYCLKPGTLGWGTNPYSTLVATDWNGLLYFVGSGGLWRTNGTQEGTELIESFGTSLIYSLHRSGDLLYFARWDGGVVTGKELWCTDGTPGGARLVKDVRPGTGSSDITWPTDVNGIFYFAADNGTHGRELWRSDGTTPGTFMVRDLHSTGGSYPTNLCNHNGTLYFTATDDTGIMALWQIADAGQDPVKVAALQNVVPFSNSVANLTSAGGLLFFTVNISGPGQELWRSDGTEAGTFMIADLNPGAPGSDPTSLLAFNGRLYFGATVSNSHQLWTTDGTAEGTDALTTQLVSKPSKLTAAGDHFFFVAANELGEELWQSDGTAAGTALVEDLYPGTTGSSPAYLAPFDNQLLFSATVPGHGIELWMASAVESVLADAGPNASVAEGDSITLTGSAVVLGEAAIASYEWDFSYRGVFRADAAGQSVTYNVLDGNATGIIALRVTDTLGNSHLDTATLTTTNRPPVLSITGSPAAVEGFPYVFYLSSDDPGLDTIQSWSIDWGDGSTETFLGNPAQVTHAFQRGPVSTIIATAKDEDGSYIAPSFVVTIADQAPQADIGPDIERTEGSPLTILGAFTDPGIGNTWSYAWDVSSTNGQAVTATTRNLSFTPTDDGVYTVQFTVTDDAGAGSIDRLTLVVHDVAPTLTLSSDTAWVYANSGFVLKLASADPGTDTISRWRIGWGDGITQDLEGNPATIPHTYATPGSYSIVAAAINEDGEYTASPLPVRVDASDRIRGAVFADHNIDGRRGDEEGIAGVTVFVDANANGAIDPQELTTSADATGAYELAGLAPGEYIIRCIAPTGWRQTGPAGGLRTTLSLGQPALGCDLGLMPPTPGHLDWSFGDQGRQITPITSSGHDIGYALVLQPDGKAIVGGTQMGVDNDLILARFQPEGQLDPSFGDGGRLKLDLGIYDCLYGLALGSDGKIVAVGACGPTPDLVTDADIIVARLNHDGSLDTSFDGDGVRIIDFGGGSESGRRVAVYNDGRIVLAGNSDSGSLGDYRYPVVRLNVDGSFDTTFAAGGVLWSREGDSRTSANAIALDAQQRLLIAGTAIQTDFDFGLERYSMNGQLDTTFGSNGRVMTPVGAGKDYGQAVAIAPSGRIVVAGSIQVGSDYDIGVVCYTSAGVIDTGFNAGGKKTIGASGASEQATAVAIGGSGHIVISGVKNYESMIVRLSSSGLLDLGFDADGVANNADDELLAMQLRSDGRIVAAGLGDGGPWNDLVIAQYTTSGVLDPAFGSGGRTNVDFEVEGYGSPTVVAATSDGGTIVGGYVQDRALTEDDFVLVRYAADGRLDPSFGDGGYRIDDFFGRDDRLFAMAVQDDGRIVVAGYGNAMIEPSQLTRSFAIARYWPDGRLDEGFGSGGKVVVSGFRGTSRWDEALALAVRPDGGILVAGSTAASSSASGAIALAMLTPEGVLDSAFGENGKVVTDIPSGTESASAVAFDRQGRIVVAGSYETTYTSAFALLRYTAEGQLDPALHGDGTALIYRAADSYGGGLALLADDRILIGGSGSFATGSSDLVLIRCNDNGSVDGAFGSNGMVTADLAGSYDLFGGMLVEPDGQIVIAGRNGGGPTGGVALARYNPNGSLDPNFANRGRLCISLAERSSGANAVSIRPTGQIVVTGRAITTKSSGFMVAQFMGDAPVTPTVVGAEFDAGIAEVHIVFNKAVGASLSSADFRFRHAGTGTIVPAEDIAVAYDAASDTARISFPNYAGGRLPAGVYELTIASNGVGDSAGLRMSHDWQFRFVRAGTETYHVRRREHGLCFAPASGTAEQELPCEPGRPVLLSGDFVFDEDLGADLEIDLLDGSITFASIQHLASLSLGGGGAAHASPGGGQSLFAGRILIAPDASLDIADNELVVNLRDEDAVQAIQRVRASIATARNDGQALWEGPGITSSLASETHGLVAMLGTDDAVHVRLSLHGDLDLSGDIDGDDYFMMDLARLREDEVRPEADLNYDGAIDDQDMVLIDAAYWACLAAPPAAAAGTAPEHDSSVNRIILSLPADLLL